MFVVTSHDIMLQEALFSIIKQCCLTLICGLLKSVTLLIETVAKMWSAVSCLLSE
jgi:hypothetical protein